MNACKSKIREYKKHLEICTDDEERQHFQYQIEQEKIKLESFELLSALSEKVRGKYE